MVDKSNALYHAHDLWQRVFALERQGASDIEAEHLFVDAAAMQLVKDPSRFDVIVTDHSLPDGTGIEMLETARAPTWGPSFPADFMSSRRSSKATTRCASSKKKYLAPFSP